MTWLYIENPKYGIRKLLELISEFSKVAGYKINTQKSLAFLYTNNEKSEREIKESIPFTNATNRIKYLGISLPKETKELYTENYKTLMKEIKDDINRWKDIPCFWVQFSSVAQSCPTLRPHESQHARPPCPSPTPRVHSNSRPSSRWCHPAISSSRPLLLLPPIPPSIRVFSSESTLYMRWPKYWSFSFSISSSNKHPGLISFRMD